MARVVSRLLLLLLLLLGVGARAAEGAEHVRTGTTDVSLPSGSAVEPPPVDSGSHESQPPSDAPRLGEERAKLPPLAAGFSTYDGGWLRITYHPSSRERIEPLIAAADEAKRDLEEWLGTSVLA